MRAFRANVRGTILSPEDAGYDRARAYLNFFGDSDVGMARTQAAYSPERYLRLVELKGRYDPENLFCYDQNIPPAPVLKPPF